MKTVCISDIHGYLETTLNSLKQLEKETELKLIDNNKWNKKHKLIINGDVFDRGPKNQEALNWVLNQENTVYLIGNHEFMAIFPDIAEKFLSDQYLSQASKEGLYWKHMKDKSREKILEKIAEGKIKAAAKPHDFVYSHAGLENITVEDANQQLQKVGERLLESFNSRPDEFRRAQESLIEIIEADGGPEIRSEYPKLFNLDRDEEGNVSSGGAVWRRFNHLNGDKKQVVGHSRGTYMKKHTGRLNPQWIGSALNINTIRDYENDIGPVAISVEDQEGLQVYSFDKV